MLELESLKRKKENHSNELLQQVNNKYDGFLKPDVQSSSRPTSDLTNDLKNFTGLNTERRRYARYQEQQEVFCTFYDILKDDFEILDAQVVNKSKSGLLLTTDMPLEMGMPILVRLKHFTEKDAHDELKDGIHAKVVRCEKASTTEKESCFWVAIEDFELGQ